MFQCESDIGAEYCRNWRTLATTEGNVVIKQTQKAPSHLARSRCFPRQ